MERFEQIEALFQEALERPAAERRAWLREVCHGDAALYREVASLIDSHHPEQLRTMGGGSSSATAGRASFPPIGAAAGSLSDRFVPGGRWHGRRVSGPGPADRPGCGD